MNNICDEFKTNCLVRPVCSKICMDIKTLVDSYLNHHIDRAWMFHDIVTNERCPVCHKEIFWFVEWGSGADGRDAYIKLACDFCYASYRLITYKDHEGRRAPSKLVQAYQGTRGGQVHHLWNVKTIKEYLYNGGHL